jgi:hypothetical protein
LHLLHILPHPHAYPDYSSESERLISKHRQLISQHVAHSEIAAKLLDTEDRLVELIDEFCSLASGTTVLIDITSFPKRFFCFFVQQMLRLDQVKNLVATCTDAGHFGYTQERLAQSPLGPDYIPGFPFNSSDRNETLVISLGYEPLGMKSILETYAEQAKPKFILSFSSDPQAVRRQWNTLRYMRPHRSIDGLRHSAEVIAAWDSERVYQVISRWHKDSAGVVLAPFGPKPHTLGMVLFATQHESSMIYTQPRAYNPSYTKGHGTTWAYMLKWDGTCCYDRTVTQI